MQITESNEAHEAKEIGRTEEFRSLYMIRESFLKSETDMFRGKKLKNNYNRL